MFTEGQRVDITAPNEQDQGTVKIVGNTGCYVSRDSKPVPLAYYFNDELAPVPPSEDRVWEPIPGTATVTYRDAL